jgi:ABC-type multidrug transport system fused ATPase/permease subunit
MIAAEQLRPLFDAAQRADDTRALPLQLEEGFAPGSRVLEGRDLVFGFRAGRPVVDKCNLTIDQGDRVLLEGPSGGGKSSLASLLIGLRKPSAGLLMLGGLDRQTLGLEGWRRRVVGAPQFHENYVLSATLAFNLLFGREWPPAVEDLAEADEICRELGLGPLLDRMPSGLQQLVGEGGWQLSHGEQSRVFIARALLQRAEVLVFDESFGALDPETLHACLTSVMRRAKTLVVIAHP